MTAKDFLFKGKRKYLTGGVAAGTGLALGSRALEAVAPKKNYQVELEIEAPWLQDMAKNLTEGAEKKGLELKDAAAARLNETLGNVDWQSVIAQNMVSSYRKRLNRLAEFASYPYRPGYSTPENVNPARWSEGSVARLDDFKDGTQDTGIPLASKRDRTLARRKQQGREKAFLDGKMVVGSSDVGGGTSMDRVKPRRQAFDAAQTRLAKGDRETRLQANRLDRYRRSLQGEKALKDWERSRVPTKEEADRLTQILNTEGKQESLGRLRESYTDLRELRNNAQPSGSYNIAGLKDASKERRAENIRNLQPEAAVNPTVAHSGKVKTPLSAPLGTVEGKPATLTHNRLPAYVPERTGNWNAKGKPLQVQYNPTLPEGRTAQDKALEAINNVPTIPRQAPPVPPATAQVASAPSKAAEAVSSATEAVSKGASKAKKKVGQAAQAAQEFIPRTVWNSSSDKGARRALGLAGTVSAGVLGTLALGSAANRYKENRQARKLDNELDQELEMRRQQALTRRRR